MRKDQPDKHRSVESREEIQEKPMKTRLSFVPKPVWWIGLVVGAVLLLAVPLRIHPVDTWIHRLLGHSEGQPMQRAAAQKGQREILFYRNPMDPTITSPVPAKDSMGMDYVPVYAEEPATPVPKAERKILFYRNPMDPTITSPVPAKDEMGMDYVPVYADELPSPAPKAQRKILFYRNPMDPTITSPVPAKDEMGMDYVPVYAEQAGPPTNQQGTVTIDPAVVQNMNVQTEPVSRRDLKRQIRTVGYLDYDQEKMVSVTTKYSGFLEKVYVNYIGQPVRKGQPLFDIYSPELVQTEQELLSALGFARRMHDAPDDARRQAQALVDAAKTRLSFWDISADQVQELEATGNVVRTLKVTAPASGVVMSRLPGLEGMAVRPGMDLFHIADLSTLWLSVEIYAEQLPWLNVGSRASVTLDYLPGETFTGRVRYLEPSVSEKTRTVQVTIEVPNPQGRLRAGMYATVVFEPVVARNAIVVPTQAILRTGERNIVIVALGGGQFAPRDITLGPEGDHYTQVLSGLEGNETIVTSAQFLIDSESNLREAVRKMVEAKQAAQAGAGHAQ
jgi:Cu(I)/Ag(I) efflux system membrane fusion protein